MLNSEEPGSDVHYLNIQALRKIHFLSTNSYFKELWKETTKQAKNTEFKDAAFIPLDQIHNKIYKPALEEFENTLVIVGLKNNLGLRGDFSGLKVCSDLCFSFFLSRLQI